jgi:hypothetical protein
MKTFKQYIKTKKKLPSVIMGLPRYLSRDSLLKEEDGINSSDSKEELARDLDKNSKPNLNANERKHVREYSGESSADINKQMRGEGPEEEKHTRSIHHISRAIQRHTLHRDVTVYTGLQSSPEPHRDESGQLTIKNKAFTSTSIQRSVAMYRAGRSSRKSPVSKLKEHIENGDHEKAKELLKHEHIYFHQSRGGRHAHEHGEKFDLNNESHVNSLKLRSPSHSGGHWQEANHVVRAKIPKGSHGLWMREHSNHPEEKEILLHHEAELRVHKKEVVPGPVDPRVGKKHTFAVVHHATLTHDGVRRKGLLSRLLSRKKAA